MIRNAKLNDARDVINLIDLALDDIGLTLCGENDRQKSKEILMEFFAKNDNIFSFKNIDVFDINGEAVGAICAYNSNLRDKLTMPFKKRLNSLGKKANFDKECFENEFYIDSVAVGEKFRGQGIATKLIENCFAKAKEQNLHKCSLLVSFHKPKTMKFYEKLGFVKDGELNVSNEWYFHMIKEIK